MTRAYIRHVRLTHRDTQEMWNRECHEDGLPEMQVVPFGHATPLNVIRSIDRADFFYSICIFSALAFVAGAVLAMGAN